MTNSYAAPFRKSTKAHSRGAAFLLEDVRSGKVFLAWQVNGEPLPEKHGFPLRVIAEDYYGARWLKYVDTVTALEG